MVYCFCRISDAPRCVPTKGGILQCIMRIAAMFVCDFCRDAPWCVRNDRELQIVSCLFRISDAPRCVPTKGGILRHIVRITATRQCQHDMIDLVAKLQLLFLISKWTVYFLIRSRLLFVTYLEIPHDRATNGVSKEIERHFLCRSGDYL